MLQRLAEQVAQCVAHSQKPDLVVITGDLAYQGTAEEYEQAEQWLSDTLLPALGNLARDRILIVPGNHETTN